MNYEKGEQIKSVEEFVKEVLAKDKPYYFYDTYRDTSKATYYHIYHEDVEWGNLFHAILKKEKVKYFQCWYKIGWNCRSVVPPYYFKNLSDFKIWMDAEYIGYPKLTYGINENCFIEVEE